MGLISVDVQIGESGKARRKERKSAMNGETFVGFPVEAITKAVWLNKEKN